MKNNEKRGSGQNVCALVMKNTAHFDPLDVKLEVEDSCNWA